MIFRGRHLDWTIGIVRPIVVLAFFVSLSACIAIPVSPPKQEKPFQSDWLSAVVVGETSREDVQAHMAEGPSQLTPVTYENDSLWIYSADRDTWVWMVCMGAGGGAACGETERGKRSYYLAFRFADDGTVADWDVTSTSGDCTSVGI